MLRFPLFTDPFYHADQLVEFDPSDVMAVEERSISLFLRGRHQVTYVTLKSGAEHALKGSLTTRIEAARQEVKRRSTAAT